MKHNLFIVAIICLMVGMGKVKAQTASHITLDVEELNKSERLRTVISQDGRYLIASKYIESFWTSAKFSKNTAPSTIIVDIKTGKNILVLSRFLTCDYMPGYNLLVGYNESGTCSYDMTNNKFVQWPIKGVEKPQEIKACGEYVVVYCAINEKYHVGRLVNGEFKELWIKKGGGKYPEISFSPDGSKVNFTYHRLGGNTDYVVCDLATGSEIGKFTLKNGFSGFQFSKDLTKSISMVGTTILLQNAKTDEVIRKIENRNPEDDLKFFGFDYGTNGDDSYIVATKDLTKAITYSGTFGRIKIWDILNGSLLAEIVSPEMKKHIAITSDDHIKSFYPLGNDDLFMLTLHTGISYLISIKEKKIIGRLYFDYHDWAFVSEDGRMDGTEKAINKLCWHNYKSRERIPLSATFQQFFTPRLLSNMMTGETSVTNEFTLDAVIEKSPLVNIIKPDSVTTTLENTITLQLKAIPRSNEPVKEIQIYVNGKSLESDTRGFKTAGQTDQRTIQLLPGENIIQAVAVSEHGYQSAPDQIVVNCNLKKQEINLYVLAVGINQYKNPKYNLNFAMSDAQGFVDGLRNGSKGIFTNTEVVMVRDNEATKANITAKFNEIKAKAQPQDVFIFYYAGHGVMSEEEKAQFYLVPTDVTQLYGNNALLKNNAISAAELQNIARDLKAQKQLFILDACQTGGMIDYLAKRGAAEEKAIAQLARSTGTVWIVASGTEQFAQELTDLKHGLFTYSILEALSGKADGSPKDQRITVGELSNFLNIEVPELSQKFRGAAQYPNVYSFGQDFPISIVK